MEFFLVLVLVLVAWFFGGFFFLGGREKKITFLVSHINKTHNFNNRFSGPYMSEYMYQNNCTICVFAIRA